jgi:exosortase family protein XrtF
MFDKIVKNKFYFFILKASLLYSFLYVFYEFYIKIYTNIDQLFIRKIINVCTFILESMGYKTFASKEINDFQVFGVDGSNGVWIGGGCNGITLMFLFAIFVIAYPGNFKNKLWYLPLGIILVNIINIIRIVGLSLMSLYAPNYLDFNHTYTFTFIVYSIVFALWMFWVNKFSKSAKDL